MKRKNNLNKFSLHSNTVEGFVVSIPADFFGTARTPASMAAEGARGVAGGGENGAAAPGQQSPRDKKVGCKMNTLNEKKNLIFAFCVSEQSIGPILKGQAFQEECRNHLRAQLYREC
jgi:hypothetical protein